MSEKVLADLKTFTTKPSKQIIHPLYDNFGEAIPSSEARKHLGIPENENIILFFGFIRKYKGLDLLLQAMKILKEQQQKGLFIGCKLLVAGEYYEDKQQYDDLIKELDIADQLILRTDFISDSEVRYYLSAADFVIQPYRNATQSGVTPLAYHFEKPMLVTNVGGLPSLVPDGKVGLVAEPNPEAIAAKIQELYVIGQEHFLPYLHIEKQKYSWKVLADTIIHLVK
jgi:glycosyltransferase involved in cell wall biosynthesis